MNVQTGRKFAVARVRRGVLSMLLVGGLLMGTTSAQGMPVYDNSQFLNMLKSLAQDAKNYDELVSQYNQMVQQYQQMMYTVESLTTGFSLTQNQLQQIADTAPLIQANCTSGSSGGITGILMSQIGSLFSQNVSDSQKQICAQIITTQVDKYNKTVVILNKMNGYASLFNKVESAGQAISTMADSGRANNQAQVYTSALSTEMNNWEAEMKADDAIISTLQQQQIILTRVALKGTNTVGNVAPLTTFDGAF